MVQNKFWPTVHLYSVVMEVQVWQIYKQRESFFKQQENIICTFDSSPECMTGT